MRRDKCFYTKSREITYFDRLKTYLNSFYKKKTMYTCLKYNNNKEWNQKIGIEIKTLLKSQTGSRTWIQHLNNEIDFKFKELR